MKKIFHAAVTSEQRIYESQALTSGPPFIVFNENKVMFKPYPTFLPNVGSVFHLNALIHLPNFSKASFIQG